MNDRLLLMIYEAYCKSRGRAWLEPNEETTSSFKVWLKYQMEGRNLEPYEEARATEAPGGAARMKDLLSKVVKGFRVKVGIDTKPVKVGLEIGKGKDGKQGQGQK